MNRKRKISGLMSLILLLAMLDGAFFPQILRLMPDTENSWQLSAALLRVTMQDCRPESEHAQVLRGTAGSESGTEIVTVRLRLLFDLPFALYISDDSLAAVLHGTGKERTRRPQKAALVFAMYRSAITFHP